jgi:hypothetical protein
MGNKKTTVLRNGRPPTEEELQAAVEGKPLPDDPVDPPVKDVPASLEDKILRQVASDIDSLLAKDWAEIYGAYRKAHIESGEDDFTFSIGLGVKLQPNNNGVKVQCKIACNVKFEDKTELVMVSNQPDMFRA